MFLLHHIGSVWVHWASGIYILIFFTKNVKFSTIMSLNTSPPFFLHSLILGHEHQTTRYIPTFCQGTSHQLFYYIRNIYLYFIDFLFPSELYLGSGLCCLSLNKVKYFSCKILMHEKLSFYPCFDLVFVKVYSILIPNVWYFWCLPWVSWELIKFLPYGWTRIPALCHI